MEIKLDSTEIQEMKSKGMTSQAVAKLLAIEKDIPGALTHKVASKIAGDINKLLARAAKAHKRRTAVICI